MRSIILTALLALTVPTAFSQDIVEPIIVRDFMAFRLSADGNFFVSQDYFGSTMMYDIFNDKQLYYNSYYPGGGNCVSNNGIIVGQSMSLALAAVMRNGKAEVPPTFVDSYNSQFESITPDGRRACGWIASLEGPLLEVPFIVEINEDGNFGEPIILPHPTVDFFGETPQFVTAVLLSDDGHTISGIVRDGRGFYSYPIIFNEDENGQWSYSLPTEPLFNPNHLPIPEWPPFNLYVPHPQDFMTEENRELYLEYVAGYESNPEEYENPWKILDVFMSEEELQAYYDALAVYREEGKEYDKLVDKFWDERNAITKDSNFSANAMALAPDGSSLAIPGSVSDNDEGVSDIYSSYLLYIFDLKENTYKKVNSALNSAIPYQVLSNGEIVMVTPGSYIDYIYMPESDKYVTYEDYIALYHPSYLPWMKENLMTTERTFNPETNSYEIKEVISGGILCFSKDMNVIVGGFYGEEGSLFSYIFGATTAAIGEVTADCPESSYIVYDLLGRKLMETSDPTDLKTLKGLYIVNGQKVKF